ncbi:hypothetical protein V490_00168 [Pseudogymnoascus sp. VKM F-3557]|nr:hypothetical protein V490_00168 [Pseudogymnoascus sp. VKM F-3557]
MTSKQHIYLRYDIWTPSEEYLAARGGIDYHVLSVASLGALITLLSLAIDPFVQSVIGLEESQVHSLGKSTSISRALRYSKGSMVTIPVATAPGEDGRWYDVGQYTADFSLQTAILFGLSASRSSISQQTTARCSGAHCKWEPYSSLSICSTCNDITNQLTITTTNHGEDDMMYPQWAEFDRSAPLYYFSGEITRFELSNGLYLDNSTDYVSLVAYSTTNRSETVTFQQNELLLWSLTTIKRLGDGNSFKDSRVLSAMECGLMYCVKNYTSEVINGTLYESSQSLSLKTSPGSFQPLENPSAGDPTPAQLNSALIFPRSDLSLGGEYNISQLAVNGIGAAMIDVFSDPLESSFYNDSGATGYYLGIPDQNKMVSPNSMEPIYESPDLEATFTNLAMSMSNSIRANDDNQTVVSGTNNITIYKISWQWLALPLANLVGGCIILSLTIFYTHRQSIPIWKSSALATLKVGAAVGHVLYEKDINGMEKQAEKTEFTLSKASDERNEAAEGLRASEHLEMQTPKESFYSYSINTDGVSHSDTNNARRSSPGLIN